MDIPNKNKIDVARWNRCDHFKFFSRFEQPFFGVNTAINCTAAYNYCKAYRAPFLLFYLHKLLMATNLVKEFRYRIEQGEVYEYSRISGSLTVLRKDETFGFAYFDFEQEFAPFAANVKQIIAAEKAASGLTLKAHCNNIVHISVLTGIDFSGFQHAQSISAGDTVPKITFGKLRFVNSQVLLPLSVHVHHALCDGFHVEKFLTLFQAKMQVS